MSISGQNLFRFLSVGAATFILAAALNYVIDPLQLFRPAVLYPARYSLDDRMQNAGLIRSQDFNTVFIGTSLAVHYRASAINDALGVKSVKLAMSGSNSVEQSFVLNAALLRRPKMVLWEMDDWIFRDAPPIDEDKFVPADYYRMNIKGISGYLLSLDTARESVGILIRLLKPLDRLAAALASLQYLKFGSDRIDDLNTLPANVDRTTVYNTANTRKSFDYFAAHPSEIASGYDYDAMVRGFERDVISLIKAYPGVEFRIYFPPYSILQFVSMRDFSPQTLQIILKFTSLALERFAQLPNVKVYDFRDAQEITHDLDNYHDVIHHSPTIDLKVLSMIAAGDHLVNRDAPTVSVERLKQQVEAYRIDAIER